MSLDNIQLPPTLVRELFKKSLIASKSENRRANPPDESKLASLPEPEVNEAAKPAAPRITTAPHILGKNQRGIAILVNNPNDRHVPDHQLTFLMKLLGACQLTIADVGLINLAHTPGAHYSMFEVLLPAHQIIGFGCAASDIQLPLAFPAFQLQRFQQQTYLFAPSLDDLESDRAQKAQLWEALKSLFQLA